MIDVRRDDGELCGYVAQQDGRWHSHTVFGAPLGDHDDEQHARQHVLADGLAALAERWTLTDATSGEEQVVCIQQASPVEVTVALDYYSLPGVPTMTIPVVAIAAGRWRFRRVA